MEPTERDRNREYIMANWEKLKGTRRRACSNCTQHWANKKRCKNPEARAGDFCDRAYCPFLKPGQRTSCPVKKEDAPDNARVVARNNPDRGNKKKAEKNEEVEDEGDGEADYAGVGAAAQAIVEKVLFGMGRLTL
jgi:hypothetical protein